jgi:hypothetical protein
MNHNLDEKKDHMKKDHIGIKHLLHMVLCCGLPFLIVLSLPFVASISPALSGLLGALAPFMCPLMMGGMLLMMFRKKKPDCCEESSKEPKVY